jgi:subtilase family serine protease
MAVDFSGTAAQVSEAFRTEIHYFNVNGARHIANMTDPSVPEALSPAVLGVVSLHDFKPHPLRRPRSEYTFKTSGGTYQVVTPGDLAAIYDLNPLFSTGITGKGQTISAIEDTDLYTANDWTTFRSTFGLSQYKGGSLTTVHPAPASGSNNCKDPGLVAGDDGEAIIDVEWASAGAPEATILLASCAGTRTTFGGFIALTNQSGQFENAAADRDYQLRAVRSGERHRLQRRLQFPVPTSRGRGDLGVRRRGRPGRGQLRRGGRGSRSWYRCQRLRIHAL